MQNASIKETEISSSDYFFKTSIENQTPTKLDPFSERIGEIRGELRTEFKAEIKDVLTQIKKQSDQISCLEEEKNGFYKSLSLLNHTLFIMFILLTIGGTMFFLQYLFPKIEWLNEIIKATGLVQLFIYLGSVVIFLWRFWKLPQKIEDLEKKIK